MAILMMGRSETKQHSADIDLKELKELLEDLLKQIVVVDMGYLYELKEYVENLIDNFEDLGLELEDDD